MSIILTLPRGGAGAATGANISIEFQQQTNVVANVESTIFDFTNSTGDDIFLSLVNVEGNARTEGFIYINDVLISKLRSSNADLNMIIPFFDFKMVNTDNIKFKVIHYETTQFIDYSTSLNYHD